MLGSDLMETTSLQDALEKLQSEAISVSWPRKSVPPAWMHYANGFKILQTLTVQTVWPTVLRVLLKYLARQIQALVKTGYSENFCCDFNYVLCGRKTSFRADAAATFVQAIRAAFRKVEGSQALPAGLEATARLIRLAEGDLDVPFVCQKALSLLRSCGQPASACLAAIAVRCSLSFRDWLLQHHDDFVAGISNAWAQHRSIENMELVLRFALSLDDFTVREAQLLVPLVADTLEADARADASLAASRFRGSGNRSAPLARLADLLAALVWRASGASGSSAAAEICNQIEKRCLVRLSESHGRELCADEAAVVKLCAAVLRQLDKGARLQIELPWLQASLAALLSAATWAHLGQEKAATADVLDSLLCRDFGASLASPGIVENLPVITTSAGFAAQVCSAADYARAALAQGASHSNFWHLLAVVLLLCPAASTKELSQEFLQVAQKATTTQSNPALRSCVLAAARLQTSSTEQQQRLLEGMAAEAPEFGESFLCISGASSTHLEELQRLRADDVSEAFPDADDFLVGFPPPEQLGKVPGAAFAAALRHRHTARLRTESELRCRSAAASLNGSAEGAGASGLGSEMDEVLLLHARSAVALRRQRQEEAPLGSSGRGAGAVGFAATWALFDCRLQAARAAQDPSKETDLQQQTPVLLALIPAVGLLLWLPQASGSRPQRALVESLRRLLQFAHALLSAPAERFANLALSTPTPEAFCAALAGLLWRLAGFGGLALEEFASLLATVAETIAAGSLVSAEKFKLLVAAAVVEGSFEDSAAEPCLALAALRLAAVDLSWYLEHQPIWRQPPPGLAATAEAVMEAWCTSALPVSTLEWESFLDTAKKLLSACEASWRRGYDGVLRSALRRLWAQEADGRPQPKARLEALAQGNFALGERGRVALAAVLTQSLRFLRALDMTEEVQLAADTCMSVIPDLILKDSSPEVQLEVAKTSIHVLFETFESDPLLEELKPLVDRVMTQEAADSVTLVGMQVAIEVACQGYMHRVLPRICAEVKAQLRSTARKALGVLDEEMGFATASGTEPSPLALVFRAPIFLAVLRARHRLTQLPLSDLGLAAAGVAALPGRGQRWGLGRHFAAAVAAIVLSEDFAALGEVAPCCGMGASSAEFQELLGVPLAACTVPLRRSLAGLQERLGEQQVATLLKTKAGQIFAFALQLPLLTYDEPCYKDQTNPAAVAAAFREVAGAYEWADTKKFVARHFRELIFYLDPMIRTWAPFVPKAVLELLRAVVDWMGHVTGSRLRLLLALLLQHGERLRGRDRSDLSTIVGQVLTAASGSPSDGLARLARQRDETLRWSLAEVQQPGTDARSPALAVLLGVLRALRQNEAVSWLHLQLESILPRLPAELQKAIGDATGGVLVEEAADGERPMKRLRRTATARLGTDSALKQLAPVRPGLSWGPAPPPDLGCVVRALDPTPGPTAAPEEVMQRSLQLLAQAQPLKQLREDPSLARALASGLAVLCPVATVKASEGETSDPVELLIPRAAGRVDELLGSVALLGATQLQAHPSARVRQLAGNALRHLVSTQRSLCVASKKLLMEILDPKHLFLEDIEDLLSSPVPPKKPMDKEKAPEKAHEISFRLTEKESSFATWVAARLAQLRSLGAAVWDGSGVTVLVACVPLAAHAPWFAERLLVVSLLKAATMALGGPTLGKDLSLFFEQPVVDESQARCLLKTLHLLRVYQSGIKGRAVPHFPQDAGDPFWSNLDLFAAAQCAAKCDSRYSFQLLELHLQRRQPDMPLDEALQTIETVTGVEALFKPPAPEIRLLEKLAKDLPDDQFLHGNSQWCHRSTRLARAELGEDHLTSLHLRSEILEAALRGDGCEAEARLGLDDTLGRLGLHPLLTASSLPDEDGPAWERRAEALWRLGQWNSADQQGRGFHAALHSALSEMAGTMSVVEGPLLEMVAGTMEAVRLQSPQSLKAAATKLQSIGAIFNCVDAVMADNAPASKGSSVANLAASWHKVGSGQFLQIEQQLALRAALLSAAKQPLQEYRFLTALAALAREGSQFHRGLALLERAQRTREKTKPNKLDILKLHWEQAQCLWELQMTQQALTIAKALVKDAREIKSANSWYAEILAGTGTWLSISKLESPEVIDAEYFVPATKADPSHFQARRQFAEFLDSCLAEELSRQRSVQFSLAKDSRQKTEEQLAQVVSQMDAISRKAEGQQDRKLFHSLQQQRRTLELQRQEDQKTLQNEEARLEAFATNCVKQLARCLSDGQGNLTQVACRFLSLWFDCQEYPGITRIVRESIPTLKQAPLLPFLYQLASRLDLKEGLFQQTLDELLVSLAQRGPQALWPLILLRNGDRVQKDMQGRALHRHAPNKLAAAKRVLERLRKLPALKSVLETVETLNKFYLAIAEFPIDKKNRDAEVALSRIPEFKAVTKALQSIKIPVPTSSAGDGSHIEGFADSFSIAPQGVSCPRIVRVRDSAGRELKQLVKGMDDLRQDAVMQQLFRLLNDVFQDTQLSLRTFQVIPLSPCAGVAEWVEHTTTLAEILFGPVEGAHQKYRPEDWLHHQCRQKMVDALQAAKNGDRQAQPRAFAEIYRHFKPVMHLVFLERFPSPQDWHAARRAYARSTAVSSIVGYIVGLGDRHVNNILFDKRTGELIHIDFGITFEAGRLLQIPEMVPFRLTRDIVAGLGCLGSSGLFRRCCELTMEVLRGSSTLVIAVTEVFVHDPLYKWSLTPSRSHQSEPEQNATSGPRTMLSDVQGNEMAKRALVNVKAKLLGEAQGFATSLGVPAHVGRVIHEATDTNNLCKMFYGWSPWL
ncbi:ATM [Symbiodinium sp. CCMP2592]|nr:ATM [Symbiodinium sp. CCMP2592]